MTIRKKEISVSKWLQNKKVVMTISIILSVLFWGIINISESPTTARDILNVPVTISLEGTFAADQGFDVVSGGADRTVTVTVSGPRYIVADLTAEDIIVSASTDHINAAGEFDLNLEASRGSRKIGYSITGISPATIKVYVDATDTKTFEVQTKAVGASAPEGLFCDMPKASSDKYKQITVKGPKTQVEKIAKVEAVAQVNAVLKESTPFEAEVKLYDADGNEMDKSMFTMDYTTVNITVPVYKSRELEIKPVFKNAPDSLKVGGIDCKLSVGSVTVKGRPEAIDALEYIPLSAIDLKAVSENNKVFNCQIDLPDGIYLGQEITSVEVQIDEKIKRKTFKLSRVNPQNLAAGLRVDVTDRLPKEIVICGLGDAVDKIGDSDISAVIDLAGYVAGGHNVPMEIVISGRKDVWAVHKDSPYTITIKIS